MLIETDYRALLSAGQEGLPLAVAGSVVAIGNFDGVHRGHQALLARAKRSAVSLGIPLIVLTFDPHPRRFFMPDQPPFMLSSPVQKAEYLASAGVDSMVSLTFDAVLANVPAEEFIQNILLDSLQVKQVVVGDNFVFGRQRQGDVALLRRWAETHGFTVQAAEMFADESDVRVSSQRIRNELAQGHPASAEALLGRPWQVRGTVERGQQRGRTIGFPTANVSMGDYMLPKFGVYRARCRFSGETGYYDAVINIGRKPTVGSPVPLLEAFLLDAAGDFYGKEISVDILDFVRAEFKFPDLQALKTQIDQDVDYIRQILRDQTAS